MSTYGDQAYQFLEKLSFPRTSGSEKELLAAQMILDEIKSYGLEPKLESFEVKWRKPVHAVFKVTAPVEKTYTVTGLINAQDTPEGGTDAEFYYPEMLNDYTIKKCEGKFVLLNERPSEEDYKKLVDVHIAGFLWLTGTLKDTPENSDMDTMRFRASYQKHGAVPAFAMRYRDAIDLVCSRAEKVHFELKTEEFVGTSHNVVTVIPGTDLADQAFAVGAHYDSTEFSYGSWDNGAGTVQMLGLLKHLSQHPPRRTIKVINFGSEEIGLNGSKAYLAAHPEEQDSLLAMVNADVGGNAIGSHFVVLTATPAAEGWVQGVMQEAGFPCGIRSDVMSSDNAVFSDYGIPTIALARRCPMNGGYMHTRYDNMAMISADVLGEEVRALIYLVERLSSAEIFPIERTITEELKDKIIKYFGSGISHTEAVRNEKNAK